MGPIAQHKKQRTFHSRVTSSRLTNKSGFQPPNAINPALETNASLYLPFFALNRPKTIPTEILDQARLAKA